MEIPGVGKGQICADSEGKDMTWECCTSSFSHALENLTSIIKNQDRTPIQVQMNKRLSEELLTHVHAHIQE
jgi:hypothetical protein